MKIQQFQGGLSTRMQPHFIQQNEGVVYSNVDNSLGTLSPVHKSSPSGILLDRYQTYYDAQQQWVSSEERRDYVEYSGDLFWADRSTQPQKFDGTTQTNLGIAVPTKLSGITTQSVDTVIDITTATALGSGIPIEDTQYFLINVDSGGTSNGLAITVDTKDVPKVLGSNVGLSFLASFVHSVARKSVATTRTITLSSPVGITIGSVGVEVYRFYQGKYYLVGTITTSSGSVVDNTADISGNKELDTSVGRLNGTYNYQLTYYNSSDGTESGPSILSSDVDLTAGGSASISSIPVSSDPQVDKKRLYRIGGNLTSLTLVTELANATTSYTDEVKDTAVVGTLLETAIALPAPVDLAYLSEAYAMLFAAQGSRLRFTPIGKPEQWPALYFLQFDNAITGIAVVTNGLLVFTKFYTYLVTGTGPTSLSQHLLSKNQGCLTQESIQTISGAALWVSSDGICTSSGSHVAVISKDTLGKQTLAVTDSVVFDEVYYALLTNGTMLCFDFAYSKIFKYLSLGNESLAIANDTLYGWSDGEMHALFAGTEVEQMQYKSPRFIEGSVTDIKTYKNVRIYHKGDIIITVFIDNKLVVTRTLKGEDSTTIKVPQEEQRGFFIQFEITGTGEVYEVEYIVGHRQNA